MSKNNIDLPNLIIRAGALIAGYATLILSLMITIEVLGRKFFNFSFKGVDEIGGYVLAIGVSFSLAYSFVMRAHTRVDILLARLNPKASALLNVVAGLMIAALAVFLCWQGFASLQESIEFDSHASTPLQTPLWLPQGIWVAGLGLFALTALVYAIRGVYLLLIGNDKAVNTLLGPRTTDDELNEALEDLGDALPVTPHTKEGSHD